MPHKTRVVVVDGLGGGIGAALVTRLRAEAGETVEIIALGTNAVAAERMVKAGAHRGAAGENAVRVSVRLADFILGPIGIIIGDSMMGEITQKMASAILAAPGQRILLPLQNEHFQLAGLEPFPLSKMLDKALELFICELKKRTEG